MTGLEPLARGFATAFAPEQLAACVAGTALGTAVGVLPGLGPVTTIALLLPFTFALSPTAAVIMLAGIYYGAQYGGSVTAILVNLPGETSSAVTCIDGHAMAKQGRARLALSVAAISSFAGGALGTLLVGIAAEPMSRLVSQVEAVDYAALMCFGLVNAAVTMPGSTLRASVMVIAGVLLGAIGTDVVSGDPRWTFGIPALYDGIGLVPLAVGLFGLGEIVDSLAADSVPGIQLADGGQSSVLAPGEGWRATLATIRGSITGATLGILPGGGPVVASFAAYALERVCSGRSGQVGRGAIEGVAGPEAANNAAAQTSFVPLLTMGIPSNPVIGLLLGALIMHGIQPGPGIIQKEPALFWGLVASMWVGNAVLLVLNLPFAGLWARLLRLPYDYLYPATIAISCAGIYAVSHSTTDLWLAAGFAAVGWALKRCGLHPAALLLGFVLSRPLEENVRRALTFSHGGLSTFLTHPLSAVLLGSAVVMLVVVGSSRMRSKRRNEESDAATL